MKIKILAAALACALSAAAQTAAYPGAIATDATLGVARNRIQTQLAVAMSAIDTTILVLSPIGIVPNMLLSIDSEIVRVNSISPSMTVTRSFDSTVAASHAARALVSSYLDAWHVNALGAEVKAIEGTLGVNLANVVAGSGSLASTYNFAAQSPGGSLIIGANVITLATVPRGVNATDVSHYLYISGGTGTAEAVLIAGGTAVSGAASGTVIVTAANTHSGAWTIASATAGGAEASQANPGGAIVFSAVGALPFYAPLTLSAGTAQSVSCTGWGTVLTAQTATADMIDLFGTGPQSVTGCVFDSAVTRTGGSAIQLGNGTTTNSVGARITGNKIVNHYQGFYAASGNAWNFQNNLVNASRYDLLLRNLLNGDQGDTVVSGNNFQMFGVSTVAAVKWESGGGLKFADNKIVATVPIGLDVTCTYVNCTGDILITGNSIEAYTTAGIHLGVTGAGTGLGRSVVGHNQIASTNLPAITVSGSVAGITEVVINGNDLAGGGFVLGANAEYVRFSDNLVNMAGNLGVAIDTSAATATSFQVANNTVFGYTPANPYGSYANMLLVAPSGIVAFASLPAAALGGSSIMCGSCTAASNPCTTGGVLTTARRVGTAWKCD
jgi:hypothetical protein